MARDHRQGDGGLVVLVKVGPVERRDDLGQVADNERYPSREQAPHRDLLVAEESVHLFDRVLDLEPFRHGDRLADGVDPRGGGTRQLGHALGVEILGEHCAAERRDPVAVERLVAHEAAA